MDWVEKIWTKQTLFSNTKQIIKNWKPNKYQYVATYGLIETGLNYVGMRWCNYVRKIN